MFICCVSAIYIRNFNILNLIFITESAQMSKATHTFDDGESNELTASRSSFCDIYKYSNRTMSFTLEKKREEFLHKQKEKRQGTFDEKRDLSQLFEEAEAEQMECDSPIKRKKNKKYPFGYKMMGSEWFTEIPEDFNDNWVIKLCPEGIRYLVVANKAITTCYYKNGRSSIRFKSKLPGGSSETAHKFTVLDCIYNKDVNTLFIYDVLAWNSMSLLNAEAHMRFFWLKSKFEENPEMCEINKDKNFQFVLMDCLPAETSLLQEKLFSPFTVNSCEMPFDGVLFYHREGHYVVGPSPLVGWLKTFMIPEILYIDVDQYHLSHKPDNYESIQQYISFHRKKKKEIPDSVEMEAIEEVEKIDCDNL